MKCGKLKVSKNEVVELEFFFFMKENFSLTLSLLFCLGTQFDYITNTEHPRRGWAGGRNEGNSDEHSYSWLLYSFTEQGKIALEGEDNGDIKQE